MKTPIFETERLILRPVTLDDAPTIQKLFNNWNIIQHLEKEVPWPYPEGGALQYLESQMPLIEKGDTFIWVLTLKSTQEIIGNLQFWYKSTGLGNRGFWLGEPFWGQGYMCEAVAVVNDFVFEELGLEEFFVSNHAGNDASRRVKEKTGAEFVEYAECAHHNGETRSERWKVTKEQWKKLRSKGE